MKFNITPSHSFLDSSPLNKYSVFSEWKNPVMKKIPLYSLRLPKCLCYSKGLQSTKKDLLGVEERKGEKKKE